MKLVRKLSSWALVALSLLASSCKEQTQAPTTGSYKTMSVTTSDQTVRTSYSAIIEGKQDVNIYPQVSGLITQVCISEGANVKKGQMLFVIDQVPYKAALETAEANVENAEAAVATAQMTAESKEQLYKEKVVSDFDLRTAKNSLRQKKAALAQAKAELTNARNDLSYTEVKSPVNGTAGMIPYRIGALVSPSISTPLVTVSDNNEMYVYFSMTETQVLQMTKQNGSLKNAISKMPEVTLKLSDGTEYSETGKIDAISGIIDQSTGAVSVRAVFPNPQRVLRSGGTCNVEIPNVKNNCIVIPKVATYELQDKIFVYKVVNGKATSTEIKVFPLDNGKEYIVESGLKKGDVIVAEGAGLVQEGTEIKN
ncbi:MAG: efflux RND transporter periplasmic adaptor subunit [Prevotellaceae bacterium]|nr:efflux RND transporter periplasmic adaptor subunit [Prevotellaceae bacterium]